MLSELYSDGALQMSRDLRFAVLQGMCVGGSTVVNNAVCIEAPDEVRQRWNGPDLKAGLDLTALQQSFDDIRTFLNISPHRPGNVSNGALKFVEAAPHFGLQAHVVDANIETASVAGSATSAAGSARSSRCSTTSCRWRRAVPRQGAHHRAVHSESASRWTGRAPRRCGASWTTVATSGWWPRRASWCRPARSPPAGLLQRSGVGRELPVGRNLSFNMATPITADFDETLRSTEGLQISHYACRRTSRNAYWRRGSTLPQCSRCSCRVVR